jgi:hypothetical protein
LAVLKVSAVCGYRERPGVLQNSLSIFRKREASSYFGGNTAIASTSNNAPGRASRLIQLD